MTFRYYLNIGTNLGNRERNLESAIKALSNGAEHVKESEVVKSKPWGFESPNEFLNVGVALDSTIEPLDMLDHIHDLEHSLAAIRTATNVATTSTASLTSTSWQSNKPTAPPSPSTRPRSPYRTRISPTDPSSSPPTAN